MTKPLSPETKLARALARKLARASTPNVVDFSTYVDVSHVPTVRVSPVDFVWEFLNTHRDTMTRREMMAKLRSFDLNRNMLNTQVSRFYTSNGDRGAWYALNRERQNVRAA